MYIYVVASQSPFAAIASPRQPKMQLQLGAKSQPSIGRLAGPAPPARVEKFEEEIRGLLGARITHDPAWDPREHHDPACY